MAKNPPFKFEFPDAIMNFQFKAQEDVPNPKVSLVYKGPAPLVKKFVDLMNENLENLRSQKAISTFEVIVLSREDCEPILDTWYAAANEGNSLITD